MNNTTQLSSVLPLSTHSFFFITIFFSYNDWWGGKKTCEANCLAMIEASQEIRDWYVRSTGSRSKQHQISCCYKLNINSSVSAYLRVSVDTNLASIHPKYQIVRVYIIARHGILEVVHYQLRSAWVRGFDKLDITSVSKQQCRKVRWNCNSMQISRFSKKSNIQYRFISF